MVGMFLAIGACQALGITPHLFCVAQYFSLPSGGLFLAMSIRIYQKSVWGEVRDSSSEEPQEVQQVQLSTVLLVHQVCPGRSVVIFFTNTGILIACGMTNGL